jgi:hypothetical protein
VVHNSLISELLNSSGFCRHSRTWLFGDTHHGQIFSECFNEAPCVLSVMYYAICSL